MKHYIDITLLPEADITLGFLWSKVFQQVHIALVDNKIGDNESAVALCIVEYRTGQNSDKAFPLGSKLRLFSKNEAQLNTLDIKKWLSRLTDYCHISSIKTVPDSISQYACFKQKRVKGEARIDSQLIRKARHISDKFKVDYEKCLADLQVKNHHVRSPLPFIHVESQQTKKRIGNDGQSKFPLFIEQALSSNSVSGQFDCYGLSKTATVPWF